MADYRKDPVVSSAYQKGDQIQSFVVREITGGNIKDSEFQFERWVNHAEDIRARILSTDKHHIRNRYLASVRGLEEDGWKMTNAGAYKNPNSDFFDAAGSSDPGAEKS